MSVAMHDSSEPEPDFHRFSPDLARLYAEARGMLWAAPAQALIALRGFGLVLAQKLLAGQPLAADTSFGELLEHPSLRRALPVGHQVKLDWLRKKGNLAAHPEREGSSEPKWQELARQALAFAHELAVWYCVEKLRVAAADLPAFALPSEDPRAVDTVCGDAIVRNRPEAMYLLGMRSKRIADAERASMKAVLRERGFATNTAHQHDVDAAHWFTRGWRRHTHLPCAYELAVAQIHGRGVEQDIDSGLDLLDAAAHWGHADAQHTLAVYRLVGTVEGLRDVPRDVEAARLLLEQAAVQEHPGAFNCLMKIYNEGLGVPRDVQKALALARRSADAGYALAQLNLANLYRNGDAPERRPGETLELLKAAAQDDVPHAHTALYEVYRRGELVPRDEELAFEHLELAVRDEDAEALLYLGCACRDGDHVSRDLHRALNLLGKARNDRWAPPEVQQAAELEHARAIEALRADVAARLPRAVRRELHQSEAEALFGDFLVLYQVLTPSTEEPDNPWTALADRALQGAERYRNLLLALQSRPDRLAPPLRAELSRLLPGFDPSTLPRPVEPSRPPPAPVRAGPKVGRNETCPCGSGSKYKRCCGALE